MRPNRPSLGSLKDMRTEEVVILARESKKFIPRFQNLVEDPSFQKDVERLRRELSIDIDVPRLVVWNKMAETMMKDIFDKFNISKEWGYFFRCYLSTNTFTEYGDPYGTEITIDIKRRFASIKVYPETVLADVRNAYKVIMQRLKDGKVKKTIEPRNYVRDAFIRGLKLQGKKPKEVRKEVDSNFQDDIDQFNQSRIANKINNRLKKGL